MKERKKERVERKGKKERKRKRNAHTEKTERGGLWLNDVNDAVGVFGAAVCR
jgi:hypothetical protein